VLSKGGQEQVDLRIDALDWDFLLLELLVHKGVMGFPLSDDVTDQDVNGCGTTSVRGVLVVVIIIGVAGAGLAFLAGDVSCLGSGRLY
jgi:hypothetical protein